jgi:hypothetical protein
MDLFDIIDDKSAIFLPIQENVSVNWFCGPRPIAIYPTHWYPSRQAISFAEKYVLFREDGIVSYCCMCCWMREDSVMDRLLCAGCNWKMRQAEEGHVARILLMGSLSVGRDVARVIGAAYCAIVARDVDVESREWAFDEPVRYNWSNR